MTELESVSFGAPLKNSRFFNDKSNETHAIYRLSFTPLRGSRSSP